METQTIRITEEGDLQTSWNSIPPHLKQHCVFHMMSSITCGQPSVRELRTVQHVAQTVDTDDVTNVEQSI